MPTVSYPSLNETDPGLLGSSVASAYEPANIDSTAATVDFDPSTPSSTVQGESSYVAPEYTPAEQDGADYAEGYDTSGLLDASVADINKLTSGSGALMRGADTRAQQAANERGLLSSSMAIGAAEAERLNTVMPLVQQTAQSRAEAGMQGAEFEQQSIMAEFDAATAMGLSTQEYEQKMLINDQANAFNIEKDNAIRAYEAEQAGIERELKVDIADAEIAARLGLSETEYQQQIELAKSAEAFTAGQNALNRSHDAALQLADEASRTALVELEQAWNADIQKNKNIADFWSDSMDGLFDILNNAELDPDGQLNAMQEILGWTNEATGEVHVGTMEAGLNALNNLNTGFVVNEDGEIEIIESTTVPFELSTTAPGTVGAGFDATSLEQFYS